MKLAAFQNLNNYFGDLHSHCVIGYGHGSIEDAFQNARLQLDFACVTPHAWWSDMPANDARLNRMVEYHRRGFQRAAENWGHYRAVAQANHEPGKFVTLLGFEWHSMMYGDHHVLFKSSQGEIIRAANLDEMREALRRLAQQGCEAMLVPHHIGYKQGYRGINWETFDPEFSPVVEIMSMHGASESDDAPYPYLHTMGPRDWKSTLQYGLAQGKRVGVIGSTDHHSAHPGSYGHGRVGVWAHELTRDGIWDALHARRTYALTGDCIAVRFAINDAPMGTVLPPTLDREIEINVDGGDELDYVELLFNNQVIERWDTREIHDVDFAKPLKVCLELGWGERNQIMDWRGTLSIIGGELISVEPRFRGHEIVAPQDKEEEKYIFSNWERDGERRIRFSTRTWGNPTTTTASTQGLCVELRGSADTRLITLINGREERTALIELVAGSKAGYLGGFLTPAYCLHRAVPHHKYHRVMTFSHHVKSGTRDWYYVRVRQKNNQFAWTSPIWVDHKLN
jgi:Protein of unknown function (DUF3604)